MDVHNDVTHPIPVPTSEKNAQQESKCQASNFVVNALVPKEVKGQVSSMVLAINEIAKSQMHVTDAMCRKTKVDTARYPLRYR